MGKKKNAKKLNSLNQQATAAAAAGGFPLTQSIASTPAFPPANNGAAVAEANGQGGRSKLSLKRERAKLRRKQQQQQEQEQAAFAGGGGGGGGGQFGAGQQPGFASAAEEDDPTAYFAAGHGHGRGEDQLSQQDFVGQPLLDALGGIEQQQQQQQQQQGGDGGEEGVALPPFVPGRRRAPLARRPAAQAGGRPPPGAPTQPRAARDAAAAAAAAAPPLGAPAGPKSMTAQPPPPHQSRPLPKSYAHPPQYWQTSGGAQTPASFAPSHVPAASGANPFGYNLQNATWDWNTLGGGASNSSANSADGNEAGVGLNRGSGSIAYTSDDHTTAGTGSAAPSWPNSTYYGGGSSAATMSGYFNQQQQQQQQQTYYTPSPFPQPFFGQGGWNPYLLQQPSMASNLQTTGSHYPAYNQGGSSGSLRYVHGHTNSFATSPFAPTASVQHSYQGHSWHVDKRYSGASNGRGYATRAAVRKGGLTSLDQSTSDNSDGGVKVDSSEPGPPARRSKKYEAATDEADQAFRRAMEGRSRTNDDDRETKSPTPSRKPWVRGGKKGPGSPKDSKAKKGPARPYPSMAYQRQADLPPRRLAAPQPLLVIIDLNGTLVHRPNRKKSSKIVCRPYVQAFLDYLMATHTVMVWSSARPENVGKMCSQLFAPARRRLLAAEWGRDTLGLTPVQYQEKVQVYKMLTQVWAAAERGRWHPSEQQHDNDDDDDNGPKLDSVAEEEEEEEEERGKESFGQHNTLLIDDSLLKASSEPHNLVRVEEFEATPAQMQTDVLRQVAGYLEEARWQADVSAWVRAGNRFAEGKGWDYAWPEGTAADAAAEGVVPEVDLSGAGFEWWRSGGGGGAKA